MAQDKITGSYQVTITKGIPKLWLKTSMQETLYTHTV